jgi:tetratricopeptide (TPR) repeat protein
MIVGTYRASDLARSGHPFLQVKRELQAHRYCRELELGPLRCQDVQDYLDLMFPGHRFSQDFVRAVFDRTEGHPLFLVDLLQDLNSSGLIARDDEGWILTRGLEDIANLPDSVRAMVDRQIANLSEEDRALLEAASVEGFEFHSAVLSSVLGRPIAETERALDELRTSHGLVRLAGELALPDGTLTGRYSFSHSLYASAFYGGLRASRRSGLSLDTAEALLRFYRGLENEVASQAGQLFEAARDWQRASEHFVIAAANAARLSGYREAEGLFERALECAQRLDGRAKERSLLDITLQLANSRYTLSQFEESIAGYEAAERLAIAAGDADAQVEAICGAAQAAGHLKRTDEMRDRAVRAIHVANETSASAAHPESVLGFQQILIGDLPGARENLTRAWSVLKDRESSRYSVMAAASYGFLNDLQSEYKEAEALLAHAIEGTRKSGCWSDFLRATWFHGMALANLGRLGEALRTLTRGMELAELNGERYWYSRYPNTIGWIHGEISNFEAALELNIEGVRAGSEAGTPESEANAHINIAAAYTSLGELSRAGEHLRDGERILNQDRHKHWLRWRFRIRLELAKATHRIASGDTAAASDAAQHALIWAKDASAWKHVCAAHGVLGEIAKLEERLEDARAQCKAALGVLREHPCPLIEWRILRAAGEAAAAARDSRASDTLLAQSVESRNALAASLEGAGQFGDVRRAVSAFSR